MTPEADATTTGDHTCCGQARAEATGDSAVDPVCGMTVARDGAKHRHELGDTEYLFCCAGCRDKFAANPAGFPDAVAKFDALIDS